MTRQIAICISLAIGFFCPDHVRRQLVAAEPGSSVPVWLTRADERIHAVLDAPTHFDFEETPLEEVIDYVKACHGIEVQLDAQALDDVGLGPDMPVTVRVRGVSLRSGLNIMLRSVDRRLAYRVADEVLLITTVEQALKNPAVRVYNVRKLLEPGKDAEDLAATVARMLDARLSKSGPPEVKAAPQDVSNTEPDETLVKQDKKSAEGAYLVGWYRDQLIVRATQQGHYSVRAILETLGAALDGRPRTSRAEREIDAEQRNLSKSVDDLRKEVSKLKQELKRARQPSVSGPQKETKPSDDDPFGQDPDDPFAADPFK